MQVTIATTQENRETIIRWSRAWWFHMVWRLGFWRAIVNGIEDTLAITGRLFLLVFLIYCGGKAGMWLAHPDYQFNEWLEMGMFVLQLAGLEGAMPGLARQAELLRLKKDHEGADKVNRAMWSARIMTILSIGEGALHALGVPGMQYVSAVLLFVRGIVITGFLVELAKIESKGPRIISRAEHEKEEAARSRQGVQGSVQPVQSVTSVQGDQGVHWGDQPSVTTSVITPVNTPPVVTCEQYGQWGDHHTDLGGFGGFSFQEAHLVELAPAPVVTAAPASAPTRQPSAPQPTRKAEKPARKRVDTKPAAITDIRAKKAEKAATVASAEETRGKIRQALLALPSSASDRAVARQAGCSPATVTKHRASVQAEIDQGVTTGEYEAVINR